ncbi:conserved unknown protein [Ectocarpus siliculosus]|uniref:C3H1-type domain-containing protein n=1 Tax=Ectocarpus siliculosus TaxID=2880 RepID=D7FNC2_ECTSI|nr:conserved unknown protein [Ectocarpus siliculosus]|eukprot:CBJ30179.1 conserved unknown protein [Ectocarpus siliculosus]
MEAAGRSAERFGPGGDAAAAAAAADDSGVFHETDDISDILNVGLGGLPTLSASGQLSILSASAQEFKPGGHGDAILPLPAGDPSHAGSVEHEAWHGESAWEEGELTAVSPSEEVQLYDGKGQEEGTGQDQDAYYAEVQLEAEVLEVLAEGFSDCSPESLQVALAKSDWNLDRASAAVLLALQIACDASLAVKPCRHLLLDGECRRSDCTFSHDFATTPCRYWLQGCCVNSSDDCYFMHDLVVPDEAAGFSPPDCEPGITAEESGGGGGSSSDERQLSGVDQFPSLPSTATRLSPPIDGDMVGTEGSAPYQTPSSTKNGVSGVALDTIAAVAAPSDAGVSGPRIGDDSPATEREEAEEGWNEKKDDKDVLLAAVSAPKGQQRGRGRKGGRGRKTRFTAVNLQALLKPGSPHAKTSTPENAFHPREMSSGIAQQDGGGGSSLSAEPGISFADVVGSSSCPAGSANGLGRAAAVACPSPYAWRRAVGDDRYPPAVVGGGGEWVSTGDAVGKQYQQAREDAAELARARNKFFTSATEAFRRGDGLLARDLARRGRELNFRMKEKHQQAAEYIFGARNPGDQVCSTFDNARRQR